MERRMAANCVNKVYWLLTIHLSWYSGGNVLNFQNDLEDLDNCLTMHCVDIWIIRSLEFTHMIFAVISMSCLPCLMPLSSNELIFKCSTIQITLTSMHVQGELTAFPYSQNKSPALFPRSTDGSPHSSWPLSSSQP